MHKATETAIKKIEKRKKWIEDERKSLRSRREKEEEDKISFFSNALRKEYVRLNRDLGKLLDREKERESNKILYEAECKKLPLGRMPSTGELTDSHISKIVDCLSDFDRELYPEFSDFYTAITPLLIEIDRPYKQIIEKAMELGLRYKDNYGVMSLFRYGIFDDKEYMIKNKYGR
jgi:hypothetical protein